MGGKARVELSTINDVSKLLTDILVELRAMNLLLISGLGIKDDLARMKEDSRDQITPN